MKGQRKCKCLEALLKGFDQIGTFLEKPAASNPMTTPHSRDESLFKAALQLPPEERAGWFDQACAGDVTVFELTVDALYIGKGHLLCCKSNTANHI
jgi:hypothetical protein